MTADKKRIYADVEFLTSVNPSRNWQHQASFEETYSYINKEFSTAGASPATRRF